MKRIFTTLSTILLAGLLAVSSAFATGDEYYNHGAFPAPGSLASSAAMRAELDLIEAGFGKLPNLAGQGGRQVIINSAGTALTSTPTDVTVESFGAVGDCATSDSVAIQNTIDSVGASGGGIVKFTSSCYAIATGLTNTYNNVMLEGVGAGFFRLGTPPDFDQASTVLKWIGGAGGVMLDMGPVAASQYGVKGGGVNKIFFEGLFVAGTGVRLRSVANGSFNMMIEQTTVVGLDIGVESTLTVDPSHSTSNWFERIGVNQPTGGGIGIRLTGTSLGTVSRNNFGTVYVAHRDAVGVDVVNGTSNLFDLLEIERLAGGTTNALLLRAGATDTERARTNIFVNLACTGGGPVSVQGTPTAASPASRNVISRLGCTITTEAGSDTTYFSDGSRLLHLESPTSFSTLEHQRNLASASGTIGKTSYNSLDSASAVKTMVEVTGVVTDNTAGLEDGEYRITTKVAGADTIQAQVIDGWCIGPANGCALGTGAVNVDGVTVGGFYVEGVKQTGMETVTYSASMTPDLRAGRVHRITVTDAVAFTINTPTNRSADAKGSSVIYVIRNTSGGALGVVTFGGIHKIAGAFTQPANGFSRSIEFFDDGTNLVELWRGAADVAN